MSTLIPRLAGSHDGVATFAEQSYHSVSEAVIASPNTGVLTCGSRGVRILPFRQLHPVFRSAILHLGHRFGFFLRSFQGEMSVK